jgi:hypothetical protein
MAPGTKDYSLTNSKDCFEGICLALIGGQYETVVNLAGLMWDPPKANYVGPRSEVCTVNEQYFAYAVKEFLLGHPDQALKELKPVMYQTSEKGPAAMAKMVRGLVEKNDVFFTEGLQEFLYWYAKWARHRSRSFLPWISYFSLPAVGLCILAVRQGLVKKSDLQEDRYLPLELISDL